MEFDQQKAFQSIIAEDENQNNLKLGDIIYLKAYLPEDNKGIISGEGFGTNKLECLLMQKQLDNQLAYKQAELNIFACLFRVLSIDSQKNEIQYNENKLEKSVNGKDIDFEAEQNVIYGQEIHLVHLYSKSYLTINSQVLAKENCCRELKLEPVQNQNSAFMFSSNTKNYGEPVLYGDILYFKSSVPHLNQWGLGIQQNYPHTEVHASQISCALKICSYHEHYENEHEVMNGDIIIFKNRLFGGYLSVSKQESVQKYLQIRNIYRDDEKINQHFINVPFLKKQENTNKMLYLYLDQEVRPNSMWQLLGITQEYVQKDKNKISKTYLIKNVLTGAFLIMENDELHLTFESISEKCLFSLKNLQKTDCQIQIGEFYRLICNTSAIQCENNKDVSVTTRNEKIYFDQQMFQVKRGPFDDAIAANKIQQFYFHILEFIIFLQEWGLDQQYCYQYNLAFYQQKQVQDEINSFYKLIKNINLFLNASQSLQNKQYNQFLLCKYDILDTLIIVLRQISLMTQSEQNKISITNKTISKIARQKFTPQLSASNKKQIHLVSVIYELIYSIIFDNTESCDYLIEQDNTMDFLFQQLSYHRAQIEKILKQALSKAQFSPHTAIKWIHKIRSVSEENLEDQMFILDVVNSLITFQNKISVQCQNLCRKQLFDAKRGSRNTESTLQTCLLKCNVSNDLLPFVTFLTDHQKFYQQNKKLCDFHKQNYHGYQLSQITFESFVKYDAEKAYEKYERYILNILSFFSRLCKGRNFKNMTIIKEVAGVSKQFIESFYKTQHSLQCKKVVMDLFMALYFDIDPLTKISTFENTCYLRRELIDFDKELESGRYFYENISSNKIKKTETYQHFQQESLCTEENAEFLQLRAYSNHIVTTQKYHNNFISLFLQQDYPELLIEDANQAADYISVANRQLSFFLSLIRLINNSIELGYNTLQTNRQIQEKLRYIFVALIIQQKNKFQFCKFREDVAFNRNLEELRKQMKTQLKEIEAQFQLSFKNTWITEFLLWSTSISDNQELLEFIFSTVLNIYKVLFYLQSNLQILNYLSQKNCNQSEMFSNHNTLLFHCLFGTTRLLKLNNEIMDYLVLSFNQQIYNLKEIKEVEILDDNTELKYFSLVNGHSSNTELIGPKEIQPYLKKAIRYVKQQPKNQTEGLQLEQSFQEVEKYLISLNNLFEETKNENKSYLHSLQNMMRNAQIHNTFFLFLLNPNEIKESAKIVYFYRRLIKFFENFTKNNQTNFQILVPYFNQFFKIILIPQPDADKFTYQSLQLSKLELWKAPGSIIEYIMDVSKNLDLKNNIVHIRAGRQYLKILQGLTKINIKPGFSNLSNQRLILHLLLQHFRDLIDPINFFGDMDNFQKFSSTMNSDFLNYQKLKLHATTLSLIADTCQNYTLGIQEAQRILVFEQLASVLQSGPYLVKAAYLKCIFELYVNFVKFNNQVNEVIDNQQVKELISQILIPDLECMKQFSQGSSIKANIIVSSNEFWKYIEQVVIFFLSLLDEYRDHERFREYIYFQELQYIQKLFQGLLLQSSSRIIEERRELIMQLIELLSEFEKKNNDLGLQKRLFLYCVRNKIQFVDLITNIEQLKSYDNLQKLQEICNQHHKNYITAEDIAQLKNEAQDLQANSQIRWFNFKKQISNYLESSKTDAYSQARENHEQALEVLKDQFQTKKEEEIKFILKKYNFNVENYELLSEDVQMLLLIDDLERQANGFLSLSQLKDFLIQSKIIFANHPLYLIKICKIMLEQKKPNKDHVDQDAIELFAQYQNAIAESEIDILSIEALQNQEMHIQLDALTLLQNILDFGNATVQQRLYQLMQNHKKLKKIFIQFCKEFYSQDIHLRLEELRQQQNTVYSKTCFQLLLVLQGLCENVHLEFQNFLKIQNVKDSVTANLNFIFETTNLLAHFVNDNQVENSKKWEIYKQGMFTLIEFSTGLVENKREITKNQRFFSSFNQILNNPDLEKVLQQVDYVNREYNNQYLQTISIYIRLIISMLEGDARENKLVYKFFLDTLDINQLLLFAKNIYQYRILPKKKQICVDLYCQNPCKMKDCSKSHCIKNFKTAEDELLIQAGINIFIIGLKLASFSNDDRYKLFRFEADVIEQVYAEENNQPHQINPEDYIVKTFSVSSHPSLFAKVVLEDDYTHEDQVQEIIKQAPIIKRSDEFFEFYREFVGRIEVVNQNGQIERVLFQKPFVCKYVTANIKFHLIYQSNRESDEDRLASLLENVDFYRSQMKHYQHMSNFSFMHFGQRHWRKLKDISYILCVFLVIFFIIMPESIAEGNLYSGDEVDEQETTSKGSTVVVLLNNIITIIQLVLNMIIIIFCAVERYPIAVNFSSAKNNARRIQILKKEAGFKIPEYEMRYYDMVGYLENNLENQQIKKNNVKRIILLLLIDFDNLYNIIVFGITIIAFFNTYVYAILLLDIIKRSEDLQNIIKAITDNTKNLILFGLLGLIGLLLYGFLLRLSFSGDFKEDDKFASDSLGYSIAHSVNLGLRNGGGIGDSLEGYKDPFQDPKEYWSRYFFDFTFFIIFNILFIQMVFGIIVDKFGELRDQRQDLLKDIQGKCFICSMDRNEIDSKTKNGWFYHIYLEHNVYHMLYYLVYIKQKQITECNQLEKYIKDQIANNQSDFFPVKATYETKSNE